MSGDARLYIDYLAHEGYRPTTDADGDFEFHYEGGYYYIDIETSDANYFQLVYPSFWRIESDEEFARAILAANEATRKTKVAKVYLRSDQKNTSASIEIFFERPEQFKPVFHRSMRALKAAVDNFVSAMR